ncbi:MAG: hypothetical protein MUD01_05195 [Chloroflexaceae bacterium]|nr:hypothetical protein [Chloroflexaceae bacterium]
MNDHYSAWQRLAPLGLLLIGTGVSIVGEATLRKGRGEGWVVLGTVGLCVLNAGVAVFGDAVKQRALYELRMES